MIAVLDLAPHPEGGHYRRTWADEHGSAIYYLLGPGEVSLWHRVHGRSEIWHFYAGAPLELELAAGGPAPQAPTRRRLGPDLARGERPQVRVPPAVWQRARSLGDWSLAGCTVTPPFVFEALELGPGPAGPDDEGPD